MNVEPAGGDKGFRRPRQKRAAGRRARNPKDETALRASFTAHPDGAMRPRPAVILSAVQKTGTRCCPYVSVNRRSPPDPCSASAHEPEGDRPQASESMRGTIVEGQLSGQLWQTRIFLGRGVRRRRTYEPATDGRVSAEGRDRAAWVLPAGKISKPRFICLQRADGPGRLATSTVWRGGRAA